VTSEEGPLPAPQRGLWPGRTNKITGVIVIAMTLIAIVAAIIGPLLTTEIYPSTAPSNWSKTYDSNLQNTSDWTGDTGCNSSTDGLDVLANSVADVCTFAPSSTSDLVSQGFQLNLALAPESQLQNMLSPLVQVSDSNGDGFSVVLADTGDFAICLDTSSDCSSCLGLNSCTDTLVSDSTVAWHTDSFVANSLAVRYQLNQAGSPTLTVFVNGQEVTSNPMSSILSSGYSIAIGAGTGGEALYTGATLYTASS